MYLPPNGLKDLDRIDCCLYKKLSPSPVRKMSKITNLIKALNLTSEEKFTFFWWQGAKVVLII